MSVLVLRCLFVHQESLSVPNNIVCLGYTIRQRNIGDIVVKFTS